MHERKKEKSSLAIRWKQVRSMRCTRIIPLLHLLKPQWLPTLLFTIPLSYSHTRSQFHSPLFRYPFVLRTLPHEVAPMSRSRQFPNQSCTHAILSFPTQSSKSMNLYYQSTTSVLHSILSRLIFFTTFYIIPNIAVLILKLLRYIPMKLEYLWHFNGESLATGCAKRHPRVACVFFVLFFYNDTGSAFSA